MLNDAQDQNRLLEAISETIDISPSYYDKAAARHISLGEWLRRPASRLAPFDPDIRPQGSFRFGTVVRPLNPKAEYDLDNVCLLKLLGKERCTQEELKRLYGAEVQGYAAAYQMCAPAEEHNRCWRLRYADEVYFHLDTLPCVPDEIVVIQGLVNAGVAPELAQRAVAITDRRHPLYQQRTRHWLSSNPRGFAAWFEQRAAQGLRRMFGETKARGTLESVPPYAWKTPLQRSIQILKRHRDVMFWEYPDLAPISMIITNLAARAYEGETDIFTALTNIVAKMPAFVGSAAPWVRNPADPAEDYGEKWSAKPELRVWFGRWHAQVSADLARLPAILREATLKAEIAQTFRVDLTPDQLPTQRPRITFPTTSTIATPRINTGVRPWGSGGRRDL